MKLKLFLFGLFISSFGFSQDIKYARAILDTLCSPSFDGRGYFNNGEKRAAEYIRREYEKIGLKPIMGNYFQNFRLPVNSIVGRVELKIQNTFLIAGADYLIDPSSPSYSGDSKVIYLNKNELTDIENFKKSLDLFENKFVIIDKTLIKEEASEVKKQIFEIIQFLKFSPKIKLNGIIEIIDEKLTSTASQQKAERPHIIVLKNKIPDTIKKIELKVESEFNPSYQSQNVIGYLEGEIKNEYIYIVGHYDHLGRMGKDVYFPGANDNASGISMILSLAKELAQEEKTKYSMVFICFGSEEIGLVGSKYYTENPLVPLEKIKFLINLDILGTGDDGIQVVNGKVHKKDFETLVKLNQSKNLLKEVKIRGEACNSDHCFFSEKGVPSFFIYTLGGISHYHNVYDKPETLPLTEYEDLFILLKDFILNK
jgi:aminopeptidase YwaD